MKTRSCLAVLIVLAIILGVAGQAPAEDKPRRGGVLT
jgi:hypothetical protein